MTKAADFLSAIAHYQFGNWTTEDLWAELSDDQVRTMVLIAAQLFKNTKDEAIKRGIWDSVRTAKT
jgi:hypothetical protein